MAETPTATGIGQRRYSMIRAWLGRGTALTALLLITAILISCGGSTPEPTPTPPLGSLPSQIAPVVSAIAPAQTRVATAISPIETQVATVAAPAATRVATFAAPVVTQAATVFDPIISTVQAQEGGVRPTQGACPADHPIKARTDLVPPRRDYWLPGTAGYDQAMAMVCFATEADAMKALFRKATS